jgi:prohibitin 1
MSAKVISGSKFSFNGAYKPYYISAVIVLLLIVTFFTMIRVVGTGQVGVVTQYGRVTGRELTEGMSFVAPWGINNVTMYDVKVQRETVTSAAASKDLQDVSSQIVLNYTLDRNSVSKVHQTIGATYVDKVISPAINEVFKAASAEYTASELITRRSEVKNDAQTTLTERLKPLGINVSQLSIVDFRFSDNFSKAIEEKQVAQQNAERAKFNLDAAFTDAQAQKAQSETLTAEYLQKQAIEKWDGKLPTYLGSDTVFNIPLK